MNKALNILNEGFLYNGLTHKNLLKFYGCYLNEVTFQSNFYEDDNEKDQEEESDIKISLQDTNIISGSGVTYQVGLITESFNDINLASYFNYFASKTSAVSEDKIWLVLTQLTDLLSVCQKKGIQHNDIRPHSIFVRPDHKTCALSYFGSAKFMGK